MPSLESRISAALSRIILKRPLDGPVFDLSRVRRSMGQWGRQIETTRFITPLQDKRTLRQARIVTAALKGHAGRKATGSAGVQRMAAARREADPPSRCGRRRHRTAGMGHHNAGRTG